MDHLDPDRLLAFVDGWGDKRAAGYLATDSVETTLKDDVVVGCSPKT